jgi:hypothetical protein
MARKTKKRGGGRKPLPDELKKKRIVVWLAPIDVVRLEEMGQGNAAEGVKKLIGEKRPQYIPGQFADCSDGKKGATR